MHLGNELSAPPENRKFLLVRCRGEGLCGSADKGKDLAAAVPSMGVNSYSVLPACFHIKHCILLCCSVLDGLPIRAVLHSGYREFPAPHVTSSERFKGKNMCPLS